MTIFVLKTFAVECGASRSATEQKPFGHDIAGEPHLIAHPLKAKHRVINIERNHVDPVCGVGGARGGK